MGKKEDERGGFWNAFGGKPKVELSEKGALAPVVKRRKAMEKMDKELFPEEKKGKKTGGF